MPELEHIGPKLLGRNRVEPDDRDYPLEAWHEGATEIEMALAAMQKSWTTSATVKRWAKIATKLIEAGIPTPTPIPTPGPAPVNGVWPDGDPTLDQGQTGHCVGFGGAQFENIEPVDDHRTNSYGHALYYKCKIVDGEPNEENGSTVHTLATVLRGQGTISAYAWATDVQTIIDWVSTKGPIVIGIDWTNDMFSPDSNNYIAPTGDVAGGHCLNIDGYLPEEHAFDLLNSWGSGWGNNGHVKMKVEDFAKLLAGLDPQYPGEAMAAIQLK